MSLRHLRHGLRKGAPGTARALHSVRSCWLNPLSSRAETHFALDPDSRRLGWRRTSASWRDRELPKATDFADETQLHIIVMKSGNLKVLQRQTTLLRTYCDPATTPTKTMGLQPATHKSYWSVACQHSKYAQVSNESGDTG